MRWVRVGAGEPRLDVFGAVAEGELADLPAPAPRALIAIRAIRIRNDRAQDVLELWLEPILLEDPIPLEGPPDPPEGVDPEADPTLSVVSIPGGRLVLEGEESPVDRLLDLVRLDGWKLELEQVNGVIQYSLHLLADWDISAHPDHYPGSLVGEASFRGPDPDGRTALVLPWPFAATGQLEVHGAIRDDDGWIAALRPAALNRLLDSMGAALAAFPLAGFALADAARLPAAIE